MRIVSDEAKRQVNLRKHGLDVARLTNDVSGKAPIVPAKKDRAAAIGSLNGETTVIFKSLGSEALSVVSMHPAAIKERKRS